MARRTLRCRKCSGVLEKEQRQERVCKYCQLKGKNDQEKENIKKYSDESGESTPATQLEQLELMGKALRGIQEDDENVKGSESRSEKDLCIDENENAVSDWKKDSSLPEGWKMRIGLSSSQKSIMTSDQEEFDSFLSAFICMANNQDRFKGRDIDQLKAKLVEEGWEDDEKLPPGWKISRIVGDNLFVLLSNEGVLYQTLDAAQEFLEVSDKYDETNVLAMEELCMGLVEEYVSKMNIRSPGSPVKSTMPKGKMKISSVLDERGLINKTILTRGTNFSCDQCGKSFRKKSKLADHASVHAGFKPYQCKLCQKAFSMEENLKTHMTNHKKEVVKLYTCQVCSKPFYYLSKIVEHMEESHPDIFPYNCNVCDQNFSRSETLRIHKKNHITTTFVPACTICNKSFQTNHNLKRHKSMFH